MCADRPILEDGPDARAISDVARRMLAALGYDIARLRFQQGIANERLPARLETEFRQFEDPRTKALISIMDSYSHEAPGVLINIIPILVRRDGGVEAERFAFHYDRLRGSLLSTHLAAGKATTEAIATNFVTQRTFHGFDAIASVGAYYAGGAYVGTVDAVEPELQRLHEALVRVFSQPRVTPTPGRNPSTPRP
jgi:hypothetical protein